MVGALLVAVGLGVAAAADEAPEQKGWFVPSRAPKAGGDLDPETRAQLEAIGYLEGYRAEALRGVTRFRRDAVALLAAIICIQGEILRRDEAPAEFEDLPVGLDVL